MLVEAIGLCFLGRFGGCCCFPSDRARTCARPPPTFVRDDDDDENHLQFPAQLSIIDEHIHNIQATAFSIASSQHVLLRCGERAHRPHISRPQVNNVENLYSQTPRPRMTHSLPFEPSHLASARTGTLTSVASLSLCPPPWVGSYTVLMCPPPCSSCEPHTSAASSALDRHVERHVERHAAPGASCRAPRALWTVAPMALSVPSHPSQSLPDQERRARLPIGARHDAPDEATHLVIDMTLPTKPPGGGTRNTQSRYVPECPGAVRGRSSRRSTHAFCAFFLPAIR